MILFDELAKLVNSTYEPYCSFIDLFSFAVPKY